MSRTVPGHIVSLNGAKFSAVFIIDEIQYTFAGNINPNPGKFHVDKAVLAYDHTDQLTATRSFTGQVGIEAITFTIENGPVIQGTLDDVVDPVITVSGTGTWTTA
ncbi:hypothetical protein DFH07DRAFT_779398 [Mycena maculata]|uniref:Uncharacterized protein n=1 Tax=Mycena maculata TaxID=230809 RepID=A0AAD7MXS8_9AGAR|nr:hypothetical protein DFH07DRAFT_779398 [Mycena maculata]